MNFFIKAGNLIRLITKSRISNVAEGVEPDDVITVSQISSIQRGYSSSLFKNTSSVSNSLASETVLYQNSISTSFLSNDGDSIRVSYAIQVASGVDTKTIKFYIGSNQLFDSSAISNLDNFDFEIRIDVTLIRVSSSVLKSNLVFISNSDGINPSSYSVNNTISPYSFSSNSVLKLTGQGTSSNQVTAIYGIGEYLSYV